MNQYWGILLVLAMGGSARAQSVPKTMKRLPDTGQTISYTGVFGEDSDYLIHPPGFVKHPDGTVTDTVTGLLWQGTDGGEMTIEKAQNYVDTLTLGGYTDWRLPSAQESFSILNLDLMNPAQNQTYFPDTDAEYWWTSEALYNNASKIWVTNSGGGIGPHQKTETISAGGTKRFHARAVRTVQAPVLVTPLVDNGDGTVTDQRTNLVWEKFPTSDTLTWEQALAYAENLVLAGHSDWRLPNIKELESINDESRNAPSTDVNFFPAVKAARYWSSTTQKSPTNSNAWFNDFQNFGITSYFSKTKAYNVWCVRSGQEGMTSTSLLMDGVPLLLFPNPATEALTIQRNTSEADAWVVSLYTLEGGRVLEQTMAPGDPQIRLDLKALASGLYILRLSNGKEQTSRKIVVQQ